MIGKHLLLSLRYLRKISGAKIHQLVMPDLLYYLWLVMLSSALSIPGSLLLMERWLRNFHYRTNLPIWKFPACAGVLIVFCSLALINPIEFTPDQ